MTTDLVSTDDGLLSFINEKELLETSLQNMMEYVPAAHIYWKDKDGKYLGCNKTQAKSLGFTTSLGLIGRTDFELQVIDGTPGGTPQVMNVVIKIVVTGTNGTATKFIYGSVGN